METSEPDGLETARGMLPVVALLVEGGEEGALLHLLAEGSGSEVDGGGGLAQRLLALAAASLRAPQGTPNVSDLSPSSGPTGGKAVSAHVFSVQAVPQMFVLSHSYQQ